MRVKNPEPTEPPATVPRNGLKRSTGADIRREIRGPGGDATTHPLGEAGEVERPEGRGDVRPLVRLAVVVKRGPHERSGDVVGPEAPLRLLRDAVRVELGVVDERLVVRQVCEMRRLVARLPTELATYCQLTVVDTALRFARAALGGREGLRRPARVIGRKVVVADVREALDVQLEAHCNHPGRRRSIHAPLRTKLGRAPHY